EPALGSVGEALQGLAVDGVDGDALARRHDADDAVARQRMAAARIVHRHARNEAADRDAVLLALARAVASQGHDAAALAGRRPRARKDRVEHLAPGVDALADRAEQVLDRAAVERLEDAFQGLHREIVALVAEGLFEDRAAKADILRAL